MHNRLPPTPARDFGHQPLLHPLGPEPSSRVMSQPSASAAESRSIYADEPEEYVSLSLASAPPSQGQLAALTAVPMGMLVSARNSARGRKGGRKSRSVARFFNVAAGRPYPRVTSLEQRIQVTVQTNIINALVASSTISATTFYAKSFALQDFGGTSSYLSVFDQYRFDKLEVWLEPTSGTSSVNYPIVATCVDLDDANTPTNLTQIEDHQQALTGEGQAGRFHAWRPHMAIAAYSGTFTSYSNQPAGWIDSASTGVQHYGFKAGALSLGSPVAYNLSVRATISFRAPGIN